MRPWLLFVAGFNVAAAYGMWKLGPLTGHFTVVVVGALICLAAYFYFGARP